MAVIDAEGLFAGNRMGLLTDGARLHFPWLLVASNGFGRLEINYNGIVARVYQGFRVKPTQAELFAWVQEYHAAGLLFLYECGGQFWGVWDTRPELLPRFKTARDKRSPTPPEPDFSDWKRLRIEQNRAVPRSIANLSEVLPQDFGNVSEAFRSGGGIGVGVGIGVGEGKNTCASPDGNARMTDAAIPLTNEPRPDTDKPDGLFQDQPNRRPKPDGGLNPQQEAWFSEWWEAYWLHKAKKAARQAFGKHVKSAARFQQVMDAMRLQAPEMLGREPQHRPHGATWLNGERWSDETALNAPLGSGTTRKGVVSGGIEAAMRLLTEQEKQA
jgi:hypothetical protein